jgi:hypothetical protein
LRRLLTFCIAVDYDDEEPTAEDDDDEVPASI